MVGTRVHRTRTFPSRIVAQTFLSSFLSKFESRTFPSYPTNFPRKTNPRKNKIQFRKNFYVEVPEIQAMTEEEVFQMRVALDNIRVKGKNCPKPIKNWAQAGLRCVCVCVGGWVGVGVGE